MSFVPTPLEQAILQLIDGLRQHDGRINDILEESSLQLRKLERAYINLTEHTTEMTIAYARHIDTAVRSRQSTEDANAHLIEMLKSANTEIQNLRQQNRELLDALASTKHVGINVTGVGSNENGR